MEWIEVTGRTIDDAKELALDRLGVVEAELEFEIVDEPKTGLFGRFGRTEARIRARVKPLSREKPGDRRRRRSQKNRGRRESASGAAAPRRRPAGAVATAVDDDEVEDEDEPIGGGRPAGSAQNRRRRRRGGGGGSKNTTGAGDADAAGSASTRMIVQEENPVDEVPIEEQAKAAEQFTSGLIEAFDMGARVHTEVRDDAVHVDIDGDGLGLLVGPRGSTLAALEEIVRAVVQRSTGGHSARVHVDVGGYRQR